MNPSRPEGTPAPGPAPAPRAAGTASPLPEGYKQDFPELRRLVPASAQRILDLRCGAGMLGALLKHGEPGRVVVGIEPDRRSALLAAKLLDEVVQGDALAIEPLPYPGESFDCLIVNGALDARLDLAPTLTRYLPYLREGGHVVCLAPNARHGDALAACVAKGQGSLPGSSYQALEAAFEAHGLLIDEVEATTVLPDRRALDVLAGAVVALGGDERLFRTEAHVGLFVLRGLKDAAIAAELRAPALTLAPAAASGDRPVASIVVLALNQLDHTRRCLESVLAHSSVPFELIVVDNGSRDGTRAYLQALTAADARVRALYNDENRGFAGGCNQGMAIAEGEVVVLLNNDTVVTPGWLEGLIRPMLADPGIGAVGPRTNEIWGPQRVSFVPYGADMAAMLPYARRFTRLHAGSGQLSERAMGFCLAVQRRVIERIGGLDERFRIGNLEDDDYCLRVQTAGFKVWLTDEVFVHHVGSSTFFGEKMDIDGIRLENLERFARKWGVTIENQAYPGKEMARRPFEPERDVFAIWSAAAPPAPIAGARGFHFLMMPAWEPGGAWCEAVANFCRAFGAADDLALLLWVDPAGPVAMQTVALWVGEHLGRLGLAAEALPDLVLFDAPGGPLTISRVLRAGQVYLPLNDDTHVAAAQACGLAIWGDVSAEGLRAAYAGARAAQVPG